MNDNQHLDDKAIYYNGMIYDITDLYVPRPPYNNEEISELFKRYLSKIPDNNSYAVIGTHTFKDGEDVTGRYEVRYEILETGGRVWWDVSQHDYNVTTNHRRIVAIPVPPSQVSGKSAHDIEQWYHNWMESKGKSGEVATINEIDMLKDFAASQPRPTTQVEGVEQMAEAYVIKEYGYGYTDDVITITHNAILQAAKQDFIAGYTSRPADKVEDAVGLIQRIEKRIAELNEADAKFCKDRWDMKLDSNTRLLAREMSNQVTFARQLLQEFLPISSSQAIDKETLK